MTRRPPRPVEVAPGVFQLGTGRGVTEANVYLVRAGSGWTLVDTAWRGRAATIRAAAEELFGAAGPAAIVLTHVHPDHSGAAQELAALWQVPVHVHPDELRFARGGYDAAYAHPLDRRVVAPILRLMPREKVEALRERDSLEGVAVAFDPGVDVPGLPGWQCVPTPGHTAGHASFLRRSDRVLITGDAVVTVRLNSLTGLLLERPGLSGPPWYTTWDGEAARASVARLARLDPAVLAGGHGRAMSGPGTAAALRTFAASLG